MLKEPDINAIARAAASANLRSGSIVDVMSAPTTDTEGDAALNITIVLTPESTASVTGDSLLKTLTQIKHKLQEAGDNRLPIVVYAAQNELAESGD
jgi:hypothetical protein